MNLKRQIFIFFYTGFLSCTCFAQVVVQGKVLTRDTNEPIPYANIGIVNSNIGTLSNPDGTFSIRVPEKFRKDTLVFSALGFGRKAIPIKFLPGESLTVLLNERPTLLTDVVVSAKKEKNKIFKIGNKDISGGVLETDTLYAGGSMALLIENNEALEKEGLQFPVYLEKASLRIFKNNLASCKFRVRLNDVDSTTGKPGFDLLKESIVVESTMRKGWLEFDLSHVGMQIKKPFFVTFEQILDVKDRTAIADGYRDLMRAHPEWLVIDTIEFEGKRQPHLKLKRGGIDLPGTFITISSSEWATKKFSCYTRETSFGDWTKVRGIVTALVTVSNQPIATKEKKIVCREEDIMCRAQKLCENFMDETGVNGMQICVSQGGKVEWSSAMGFANVEKKIPTTTQTRFRINSISKAMTSAALVKLASEGKLDLDALVQKYVPGFPVKKYPVTTRQLAGHLAGIRDYNENDLSDFIRTEHYANAMEALNAFKNDTLLFEPGTQFHYSTYGWNLIGAVIEGASGQHYLDYMKKNVWEPFGLSSTCGDDVTATIPNRSTFYDLTGQPNDLGDLSYKYAGGGLLSTAEDLVKFGNELLHGGLSTERQKLLFSSQKLKDGSETGYGIGWYIGKDRNGHRIWYHAGDSFSSSSWLVIYPDKDLVIAFLANSQHGAAFDIYEIAEMFYENK